MIFFDTNIWINLLAVKTSDKIYENEQIKKASALLNKITQDNREQIVTCREQQIEIINAIQKIKYREYNRMLKISGVKGIGSVKEFRKHAAFKQAIQLCKIVYNDMQCLAITDNTFTYNIEDVISNMGLFDINDFMYLNYCRNKNIKLYTFDKELASRDIAKETVILL